MPPQRRWTVGRAVLAAAYRAVGRNRSQGRTRRALLVSRSPWGFYPPSSGAATAFAVIAGPVRCRGPLVTITSFSLRRLRFAGPDDSVASTFRCTRATRAPRNGPRSAPPSKKAQVVGGEKQVEVLWQGRAQGQKGRSEGVARTRKKGQSPTQGHCEAVSFNASFSSLTPDRQVDPEWSASRTYPPRGNRNGWNSKGLPFSGGA
jgi:hypothetical protein